MNQNKYALINNSIGWLLFAFAVIVFYSTLEPTTPIWDCGEFIAAAYKLQVVHPPGAPFFLMLNRLFSMLAPTQEWVPILINGQSATSSAFAVLFLFWSITMLSRKILVNKGENPTQSQVISIMGSGIVGASAFTFTDTFWFSAVEGEVYALSALFMAVALWLGLKWESRADEPGNIKYLILIAYLAGLSLGVHLLSLLILPVIAFIYYFRKFDNITWKGIVVTGLIGLAALVIINTGVIKTLPWLASEFELLFVNSFGFPFWSGIFFTIFLVLGVLIWALYYTYQKQKAILHTALIGLTFVLLGFSSYSMVVIRSQADPSIDMNNPETVFNLISYLNREQYGDRPLLYGHYFNADRVPSEGGEIEYRKGENKYLNVGRKPDPQYAEEDKTIFPRMISLRKDRKSAYRNWVNIDKNEDPTFADNLEFFFKYQIGHMYWRYFAWNFIGRQNDIQGHGQFWRGNWLSGLSGLDQTFSNVAKQTNLPSFLKSNKARNPLYFLPFLMGLLGLFFHFNKKQWDAFTVLVFFLMTGFVLILYLNQPPREPRERDYTLVGSFYAFAIWIGIGVLALVNYLKKWMNPSVAGLVSTVVGLLLVTAVLGKQEWNDHDRSDRYTSIALAKNQLRSMDSNAVFFAYGDNETYPLWYAQEVEDIRTDVRVINLNLMNARWYVEQLRKDNYLSEGLQFNHIKPDKLKKGKRKIIRFADRAGLNQNQHYDIERVLEFIASDKPNTKVRLRGGGRTNYLPTKKLKIDVDKQKVLESSVVDKRQSDLLLDEVKFKLRSNRLLLSDLMILDLIASTNFTRPIYFSPQVPNGSYFHMNNHLIQEGLSYKLAPIKKNTNYRGKGMIDTKEMYNTMVKDFTWGGLPDSSLYLGYVTRRNFRLYRNHFSRLSQALINEGKTEKAEKVLDTCFHYLPNQQVYFDASTTALVNKYYDCNAPEKGKQYARILYETLSGNLEYFTSLSQKYQQEASRKIRGGMSGLYQLREATKKAGQKAFSDSIQSSIQEFQGKVKVRRKRRR